MYASDEEAAEAVKSWWRENGTSVIAGLVIGLVGVFGWQGWQKYQSQQAMEAADRYAQLASAKGEAAEKIADSLIAEYPQRAYAALAALELAGRKVEAGELDAAVERLTWVRDHAAEAELKSLATLRLARVLLAKGEPDRALELVGEGSGFDATRAEVKGDILQAKGDTAGARAAYRAAVDAGATGIARLKLDDLGS